MREIRAAVIVDQSYNSRSPRGCRICHICAMRMIRVNTTNSRLSVRVNDGIFHDKRDRDDRHTSQATIQHNTGRQVLKIVPATRARHAHLERANRPRSRLRGTLPSSCILACASYCVRSGRAKSRSRTRTESRERSYERWRVGRQRAAEAADGRGAAQSGMPAGWRRVGGAKGMPHLWTSSESKKVACCRHPRCATAAHTARAGKA